VSGRGRLDAGIGLKRSAVFPPVPAMLAEKIEQKLT
jgi:hypothetical protein